MKVAFINGSHFFEINNKMVNDLRIVCNKYGHTLYNFGMINENIDISYVEVGILTSLLLNSGAVDYVVTGCTSGQGVNIVSNSFPNVICGHIENSYDAMSFTRINDGNAVSIPFTNELNINYIEIFETLFKENRGEGYPISRSENQRINREIINDLRNITHRSYIDILKDINKDILLKFKSIKEFNQFYELASNAEIKEYIERI